MAVGLGVLLVAVTYILLHKRNNKPTDDKGIIQKQKQQQQQTQKITAAKSVASKGGVGDDDDEELDASKLVPPKFPEDQAHIHYQHVRCSQEEMLERSKEFYDLMNKRRSVRFFSKDPVPLEVMENIIKTAG